jgi:UBX domain
MTFLLDTVFCVPRGLPPACTSKAQRQRGLPEFWWKESDLVAGKTNAVTGATDPWRDVGSGMRLDGKLTAANGGSSTSHNIEGLTEDEMLQMALAASMDPNAAAASSATSTTNNAVVDETVELTAEPPLGTKGSTKIQFRMPDGKRVVRRFIETDPVGMIYAFVESESNGSGGKSLDLKAGFPPKALSTVRSQTIAEAGLLGEAIQCRYV